MMQDLSRRVIVGAPILLLALGGAASASASGPTGYGDLNDDFLARNPRVRRAFEDIHADVTREEALKIIGALRNREERNLSVVAETPAQPTLMGGKQVCVKVHRWVLMTIYVAWKANGWGAALAAIPAATVGIAPGVLLAAIGIGYSEGAGALKKYIDSHSVWPRKVCAWVS